MPCGLAGYRYGHGPSGTGNRHALGGLTDRAFTLIPMIEAGQAAVGMMSYADREVLKVIGLELAEVSNYEVSGPKASRCMYEGVTTKTGAGS